jgi:acyl-CoA thioesterase-1
MTSRFRRLIRSGTFCIAVSLSLLVFPEHLPWMLLGWIAAFSIQQVRGLRGWPPLALGASFVIIKWGDWAPGLIILVLVMLACAAADWTHRRRPWISSRALTGVSSLLLAGAWIFMALDWRAAAHTSRHPPFIEGRPVLCVGDSLASKGFPRNLAERLRVPVTDVSFPGVTAVEGRQRLAEGLKGRPQAVVIELGGHDFLKGRSRRETRGELEAMILESRAAGAEVILFEIPRGVVMDTYRGLERELAREHDVELVPDGAIRQLIFFSPLTPLGLTGRKLSNDGLHPNERGHAFLCDRVVDALERVFGRAILRER